MNLVKTALVVQHCMAGRYKENISASLVLIKKAVEMGAEFIVFPEMNLTGYVPGSEIEQIAREMDSALLDQFSKLAVQHRITLLIGTAEKNRGNIYASHLVFNSNGYQGQYRKIHTAPYEKKFFSSGDEIPLFESCGITFGIQLCYDAHFPELSLAMALKKADVIFIPHASPRGTPLEKFQSWIRHLRARAFDNGVFIAACNQVGNNGAMTFPGISLLIGPDGNVVSKSLTKKQHIHLVSIDKTVLSDVRSHKMRYFIPNRRNDLFSF